MAVALLLGELVDIAVGGVESVVRPADESQVLLLEVLVQTLVEVAAMVALKEGRRRLILAEIKVWLKDAKWDKIIQKENAKKQWNQNSTPE